MRKILSFVAAMFVALAVNAQELPSTDFAAPGYSCAADAAVLSGTATELSGKFYLDETASPHHIAWSDLSKQYTAVATWRFHASRACYVTVTLDLGPVIASNKHIFDVELHAANGDRLDTIAEGPNYTGDGFTDANGQKTLEGQILIPAAGDYYIELRNNRDWCKGSIKNVILTYAADAPAPIGAPAYYLVGNMNNWTPDSAYMFAVNPANENEYMLNTTLAVGDSVKVLGIVGNTQTWYPDNAPNYGVDAAHAGKKTIYFQTTYKADWAEFGGYFWMEANPAPEPAGPYTLFFNYNNNTGSDKSAAETKLSGLFAEASLAYIDTAAESTLTSVYLGRKYKDDISKDSVFSNVKFGTSSAAGTLKFALKDMNVDSIIFRAAMYGDSEGGEGFTVNGTSFTLSRGNKKFENLKYVPAGEITALEIVQNKANKGRFYMTSITVYPKAETPQPGCDWDNIEFLGDGSSEQTYANQFKVCKDGDVPTVVNIQTPGFATGTGIYMTFPDAVIGNISLPADQYKIEGAGVIFYLTAFTAKETEVTLQWQNGVYSFTVLNVNGTEPQPEVNYSLKNNWDAAADWTWKEMTKDGDNYKLENVVFGGTGVNYQADLPGAPEMWVPMDKFLGDKVDAKDTVTFVLNPADSTITATLLGKYIEPTPVIPMALYKAVAATDTAAGAIYVDNEYMKIQTVYKGTIVEHSANIFDETFTHAIQVRVDNFPTAENPTGTKKDGSTPLVITAKKSAPFILYYVRQAIDKKWTENDNKDMILFDQAAPTTKLVAASMVEDSVLVDSSYYYIGKAFELVEGHTYTLAAKGTTIKLLGFKYPDVQHTYTVAGAPATLFGQEWAPSYAANDLEPIVGGEYTHGWKKDSVALAAGEVTFKIVEDHAWTHAWPAQNYVLNIPEAGLYNITILFNQYAEADSLRINAITQKVGEAVVIPVVTMHGTFTNPNWATTDPFTLAADSLTASLKLNLEAKTYEFGMKFDGTWKANGANITREAPSACLATGDGNMHITADQAGEYTFTYTFATQTLEVAYPELIVLKNCLEVYSMAKNDVVNLNPVTVTYVNGKNVFVKDEAGAMLLYMPNTNFAWKAGDQLTGLVAPIDIYNGLYELKPDTNQVKNVIVAEGAAPAPEEMTFISDSLDMNKYIVVRGIEFAADTAFVTTKSTTININVGNQAIALYNKFKLAYAFEAGKKYDIVAAVSYYNALQLYFISAEESVARPTTAPAAPTQAEEDVMAIYCDYYKTNNLHFGISGWAGAYETLNIEDTKIAYWKAMTWECVIDPVNTDSIHDLSGYKKLHVDFWAPAAAKIKFTAEAVAGGNYKDGVVLDLAEGWNSWDIEIATWPGQYDFANLKCFALEGYKTPEGESFEGNPFAVANIYFYDKKAEGFENIDASVKAVKVLQNGQIFILRGDKVYTVTGQPIAK